MKVVAVACPHCGARLRIESTVLYVRCEYCGTAARLQAKTRMLERVVLPPGTSPVPGLTHGPMPAPQQPQQPPPQQQHPYPHPHPHQRMPQPPVPQVRPPAANRGQLIVAVGTMMALGTAGGAAYFTSMKARQATAVQPESPAAVKAATKPGPKRQWIGDRAPLTVDIDRDSVPDVIGRTGTETWQAEVRIVAVSGASGKLLWESEVIAERAHHTAPRLVIDGELILIVENHTLRAFAVADGKSRWSAKLDERISKLCAGDDSVVLAMGADDALRSVQRADGAVVPNAPGRKGCKELSTDESRGTNTSWADGALGRKHGLSSPDRFTTPMGPVFAGSRSTGTPIAMLAAFDAKGGLRWKAPVSPDPLDSNQRTPGDVVIGDREVCCTYSQGLSKRKEHLACFALEDGRRLWDLEQEYSPNHLRVIGRTLLGTTSRQLMMFELESGKLRWAF
jgi:outer membrane protein assembly factor BamB